MLPRARAERERNLEKAYALFPALAERRHQAAGTLSGGEQQMLAIGRCLMGAPELVMFDEPSLGLAPTIVQSVLKTVRDLNREGLTCVLVEQNVAVSLKLASHAYVLENGRITLSGSGEALLVRRPRAAGLSRAVTRVELARPSAHQHVERGHPHAERAFGKARAQQLERFGFAGGRKLHDRSVIVLASIVGETTVALDLAGLAHGPGSVRCRPTTLPGRRRFHRRTPTSYALTRTRSRVISAAGRW